MQVCVQVQVMSFTDIKTAVLNRRIYVRGEKEFWSEAQTGCWLATMNMHAKNNII